MKFPKETIQGKLTLTLALLVLGGWVTAIAQDARFFRIVGPVVTRITEVTAEGTVTWTNLATNATFTVQAAMALPDPTNWVDWLRVPASNAVTSHRIFDLNPPSGMVLIPAGSFMMGAPTNMGHESYSDEVPQHSVYVSAFYMDRYEVTKVMWDTVYQWATNHGYTFEYSNSGQGKAANHPAHTMTWFDAVKWCNARSEREGKAPAYYTDAGLSVRYRSGQVVPYVNWNSGYRLPTEAEWEKAARGGASGQRFPWGNTISQSQASYHSYWSNGVPYYPYDVNATSGFHPTFATGGIPYTSPVGYFAADGYGLYDMAGNVWEWCWDWWSSTYYSSSPGTDPRGPTSPAYRVLRGGGWNTSAIGCRAASCGHYYAFERINHLGFRSVLPPGQ